jgi:hypothetical protein
MVSTRDVEADIAVAAEGAVARVAGSIGNDDTTLPSGKDQEEANPESPLQEASLPSGDTETCTHDESSTVLCEPEINTSNPDASSAETSHTLTKAASAEDAVEQRLCLVVCKPNITMASIRDVEADIAVAAEGGSIGRDNATPPSGEDPEEVDIKTTLPSERDPEEAHVVNSIRPGESPLPEAAPTENREHSTENQKQCICVRLCTTVDSLAQAVFYTVVAIIFFPPYVLAMIVCRIISARQKDGESEEAEHEYQPA